jgi:hypothetical protein
MMKPPEPLPEDAFWALVDASGGAAERLKPLLMCLSRDDLLAFDVRLHEILCRLDRRDIHAVTGGSEDGFLYIRLWIVSRGRVYAESVLRDPENTLRDADDEENEDFMYAASEVYQEMFGEAMPYHPKRAGLAVHPELWEPPL